MFYLSIISIFVISHRYNDNQVQFQFSWKVESWSAVRIYAVRFPLVIFCVTHKFFCIVLVSQRTPEQILKESCIYHCQILSITCIISREKLGNLCFKTLFIFSINEYNFTQYTTQIIHFIQ